MCRLWDYPFITLFWDSQSVSSFCGHFGLRFFKLVRLQVSIGILACLSGASLGLPPLKVIFGKHTQTTNPFFQLQSSWLLLVTLFYFQATDFFYVFVKKKKGLLRDSIFTLDFYFIDNYSVYFILNSFIFFLRFYIFILESACKSGEE